MIGVLIGVGGAIDSAMQRYRKSVNASYAAERDFAHIRRNQEQFKEGFAQIQDEVTELNVKVAELRMQVAMMAEGSKDAK